jgi:hypothetical protein
VSRTSPCRSHVWRLSSPLRSTPACVPRLPPGATRIAPAASLHGRRPQSRRLATRGGSRPPHPLRPSPCRHPIRALALWSGLRTHCCAPHRGCQPASHRRTRPRSVRPAPPPSMTDRPLHFPCQREEEEDNYSCTGDPTIWIFCGCALCDSMYPRFCPIRIPHITLNL